MLLCIDEYLIPIFIFSYLQMMKALCGPTFICVLGIVLAQGPRQWFVLFSRAVLTQHFRRGFPFFFSFSRQFICVLLNKALCANSWSWRFDFSRIEIFNKESLKSICNFCAVNQKLYSEFIRIEVETYQFTYFLMFMSPINILLL